MSHDQHHHDHGAPAGPAFALGAGLNILLVAAQIVFGVLAASTALLADAVHNFGDVLGLMASWGAAVLARRTPSPGRTYGWGRSTMLAGLANAVVVLLGCGAIAVEAVQRLHDPGPVRGGLVMAVAAAGILVNGGTALLFMRGRSHDLNVRGAFLHMASDAAVSAGVVLAALLVTLTGISVIDPITSLLIVVVIVAGTWGVLRDAVNLSLDAVPGGIDAPALATALRALPGVAEVHDLHVWGLSTTESAMTAHVVRDDAGDVDAIIAASCALAQAHGIDHATVQVETGAMAAACTLRPAHVV